MKLDPAILSVLEPQSDAGHLTLCNVNLLLLLVIVLYLIRLF